MRWLSFVITTLKAKLTRWKNMTSDRLLCLSFGSLEHKSTKTVFKINRAMMANRFNMRRRQCGDEFTKESRAMDQWQYENYNLNGKPPHEIRLILKSVWHQAMMERELYLGVRKVDVISGDKNRAINDLLRQAGCVEHGDVLFKNIVHSFYELFPEEAKLSYATRSVITYYSLHVLRVLADLDFELKAAKN